MASLPLDCVDIFDDFDDADSMEVAYCEQVSSEEYEEDVRSETDKALGELCAYLDQNPELYARVLRKRKQEEMENAGIISYVKSKMMSLLHGEQYPHCLVTASECVQQTNTLKAGMCKTFQFSQELKGNVTRHSTRLAAKRQAKMSNNNNSNQPLVGGKTQAKMSNNNNSNQPLVVGKTQVRGKPSNTSSPGKSPSSGSADIGNVSASQMDRSPKSGAHSADLAVVSSAKSSAATVPAIVLSEADESGKHSNGNNDSENMKKDVGLQKACQLKASDLQGVQTQPALLEVSSTIVVTPPPAPPLPANFIISAISRNSNQKAQQTPSGTRKTQSPKSHRKNDSPKAHRKISSQQLHTPKNAKLSFQQERRSSPRVRSYRMNMEELPTRSSSLQNLSALSGITSVSSPFLTPEVPSRYKTHKRTQSNSSLSSLSSYGSCSSIHSEILQSNPISRLKATPVLRSPGGTPLRQKTDTVLSEPFHRALYTAIRSRFRNVNTPSPRSGDASVNASNNSMFNNTFSP